MKKRVLLTSIMTILLCLCLITGSTFAVFRDTITADISVTAGQVKLDAYVVKEKKTMSSLSEDRTDEGTFANGGTAKLEGNSVTLKDITPGDSITFPIKINDYSTVKAKYMISARLNNSVLADLLKITVNIGGVNYEMGKNAYVMSTDWVDSISSLVTEFDGVQNVILVTIELPKDVTVGQGESAQLTINIDAIQANAA